MVVKRFNDESNELVVSREQNYLRKKFDEMAATEKYPGDPFCPPRILRAKQIARDICVAS